MKTTIRCLSVLLTVLLLFSCAVSVGATSPFLERRYGDLDGDFDITSTDARLALRYCAGKGDVNTTLADVDGDGEVTTSDARLILQAVAGKENYSCVGAYQEFVYPVEGGYYLKKPKIDWGILRR